MKKLFILAFLLVGLGISSAFMNALPQTSRFRIIGCFFNRWGDVKNIPFKYLTTINYGFASINPSEGSFTEDFDPSKLKRVVAEAKKYNVEVLLSVGGPNTAAKFRWIMRNPAMRRNFVKSAMQMVRKYDLDGIDIDWEYPDLKDSSSQNFTLLLKDMYGVFSREDKLLSVNVNASGYAADCFETKAFPYVSYLNIMAYDDDPKKQRAHSTYAMAKQAMDYWITKRKLPRNKAVLGVPAYGRSANSRKAVYYKDLIKRGASPKGDVVDSVYYNGITTISKKAVLAKKRAGGIFMWELNLDTEGSNSLIRAIYNNTRK